MARDNRIRYKKDPTREQKLRLASVLVIARRTDGLDYDTRNKAIYSALAIAANIGYPAGIRFDPDEPEWPVAFIELPTGQISYHLPQHEVAWDKHTDEEKNARLEAFVRDTYHPAPEGK